MVKWVLGVKYGDFRPRKPSTKPLVQKAIARNLVREYGLSPREAEKFSRDRRKITIKRPAIRLPIPKGFELGKKFYKKVILKSIPRPRRYDRKVGVKTIPRIKKLEELRQSLRQRFRPVQLVPRVPMVKGRVTRLRVTRRIR